MKIKNIAAALLVGALSFGSISSVAYADQGIKIAIDNEVLSPEQEPVIINGRTMVPVRFISEELDYNVDWDSKNRNVYITDDNTEPKTFSNNTTYVQVYFNNDDVYFPDQKPVIVNGSTLVPISPIATTMGFEVRYDSKEKQVDIYSNEEIAEASIKYTPLVVDGGDLSGVRQPNVVVDIGYGARKYYAYTNEYGQLVKVTADEIILQDPSTDKVLSNGRYYADEAKVAGTELAQYDEGHVIADSLGGVANAYNITPQESNLNRHGDQAYMEKIIRDAGGATDFTAIITYPNEQTQIPSHYSYTYTINGHVINDEFDNVDPEIPDPNLSNNYVDDYETVVTEATNKNEDKETTDEEIETVTTGTDSGVIISGLDKKSEVVTIKNTSDNNVDITGWTIVSVKGGQDFTFPTKVLKPNETVKVGDTDRNTGLDYHWLEGKGVWNNTESDPAKLYDSEGNLVDTFEN